MPDSKAPIAMRMAAATVVVALVVLAIKYYAYVLTGSVALFSDALESIVNVVAGLVALWAVAVSYKPADTDHPFGHTKAEYFSAVVEGVLIVVAALLILNEAWGAYSTPRGFEAPVEGLLLNGGATVINAVWATLLMRLGRTHRSPALAADGRHIRADVVTSVGVIAGLAVATVTGWSVLDPIIAALVALNILWEGTRVVTSSLSGLMDQAIDAESDAKVRETISLNADGAIEVHDLKTRLAGRAMFIEFHLVVPGEMTVAKSHRICDRIEDALQELFAGAKVLIHVEPEDEAKQTGVPVL